MTDAEQNDLAPGDLVELNSGGPNPPAVVAEITMPGKNPGGVDAVIWWRNAEGKPQIIEIDARCLTVVARGGGRPL